MNAKTKSSNRRGAPWTVAELKQLGKFPDSVLARRTGRTIKEVVAMREHRRIRLPNAPRRWTAREIKMLGRYNDHELARRLRRPVHHVRIQRVALHIPPLIPCQTRYWTPAEEKLLGTASDALIARKLGRTEDGVAERRRKLGIPKSDDKRPRYTATQDRLLGTMPDEELARRLGRTQPAIQFRRISLGIPKFNPRRSNWKPDEESLLGTMPDEELAPHLHRTFDSVRMRRFHLGIPVFVPKDRALRASSRIPKLKPDSQTPKRKSWQPKDDKLLGTQSDEQIAILLRRTVGSAKQRRFHCSGRSAIPSSSCGPRMNVRSWASFPMLKLPGRPVAQSRPSEFTAGIVASPVALQNTGLGLQRKKRCWENYPTKRLRLASVERRKRCVAAADFTTCATPPHASLGRTPMTHCLAPNRMRKSHDRSTAMCASSDSAG